MGGKSLIAVSSAWSVHEIEPGQQRSHTFSLRFSRGISISLPILLSADPRTAPPT